MKSLDKYAQEQSLAISNRYLSFGDYATGDAYTLTDDGEIQVSDKGKPGKKHLIYTMLLGLSHIIQVMAQLGLIKQQKIYLILKAIKM